MCHGEAKTLQIKLLSTADTGYLRDQKDPRTKPEKLELKNMTHGLVSM